MKTPKPDKPRRIQQTPQSREQDANPYSLELVANIAMQMISSQHVRSRNGSSGLELHGDAALFALHFLDECNDARLHRQARRQQQFDSMLHDAQMKEKYPNGMPLKEVLLYITGSPSEADALPAYKTWLREQKLADWSSFPPKPASEEAVTQFLEDAKKNNIPIFEDRRGMPPLFTLNMERFKFQLWKENSYIPAVRRASAGKRQKKTN